MWSGLRMTLALFLLCSVTYLCGSSRVQGRRDVLTNHWAVRVPGGPLHADTVAQKYGYRNLGQIGSLQDHYHFHHSRVLRRALYSFRGTHSFIHMDPQVQWAEQQKIKIREKRFVQTDPSFNFNDPKWSSMWYIHCNDKTRPCRSDMNILRAWQRGYTGKNVVVTILDDGIERNHPDLAPNYDHLASYDVNGNDFDPTPRYDFRNENIHGTRCAGEVAAAANNSHCIVGVAFNARIGGIRMLDGEVTDLVEAQALGVRPDYISVYSSSWGPKDDGRTVDGPGPLTKQAFEQGIKKGRKGLGSIFVWATGNGGREFDHCSCDGYTNSVFTVSIASTTEHGDRPWYLEPCSAILAATYSRGELNDRRIVTTDLRHRCTDGHTGTSVSAPIVAGIIALALEANLLLTWRDVQHLLVKTSRPVHLRANDWKNNAAGFTVSHLYGFGLVDAEATVLEARKWRTVPAQHICSHRALRANSYIQAGQVLNSSCVSSGCSGEREVNFLEHVVVTVLLTHPRRGDLHIQLISPSGTRSQLLDKRLYDSSNEGFRNWEFMSVHFWGEKAKGSWTLEITDSPSKQRNTEVLGNLKEWSLTLYGTSEEPYFNRFRSKHQDSPSSEAAEELDLQEEEEKLYNGTCHSECGDLGCDGPDVEHCLHCLHYSLQPGRACVSQCPGGYFGDLVAHRCRRCHRSCDRCVGGSETDCVSCRRGLYLNPLSSSCVHICPQGYYGHDKQQQCLKCHSWCRSCLKEPDRCTACKHGYSLAGMTCVPECNNGTFFHLEEMSCSRCHTSCQTCTGPGREECVRCAEGLLQQEWSCVHSCSPGYFSGQTSGDADRRCLRCEENCVSCSAQACVRCKEGFVLVSKSCVVNSSCNNGDEVFCEMVNSNRLCEKKLYHQFCCKTCLLYG